MPKKKVTIKPKQGNVGLRGKVRRAAQNQIQKEISSDGSVIHSDESESDDSGLQSRIDEDLESPSDEEEEEDTDDDVIDDDDEEEETETEYESEDENHESMLAPKKIKLNSRTDFKIKKPKAFKEPKWKWKRINNNKWYSELQKIKIDKINSVNSTSKNSLFNQKTDWIYYLQLLLDERFFEKVVEETNLAKRHELLEKDKNEKNCVSRRITRSMTKRGILEKKQIVKRPSSSLSSHTVKWKNLTVSEFKIFLGLFYWMGLVRLPEMEDHWSMETVFRNIDFSTHMSRDRFLQILRSMKFHDSHLQIGTSPENRLSVLMHAVLNNSRKFYTPSSTLSLDESMVSFKGRHKDKVFMPSKPIRIGFKAFVVCEADTGFLLEWKMYNKDEGNRKTNRIVNTVKSLLGFSRYQSKVIYMDRFYSNKEVFKELLSHNIYACGTIIPSKAGITEEMKVEIESLEKEQTIFYQDERLLLCVWRTHKDKLVYILSSILDNTMQDSKRYCIEEKKEIEVKRPAILEAYNENMRGVDYFDRYLRFYSFLHGSKKWYLKIAYYFLAVAPLNSYVIYQQEYGIENCVSRKKYMINMIHSLLGMGKDDYHVKRTKLDCCLIRQEKPRMCTVCNAPSKRRRTRYYCNTCACYVCAVGCYDKHRLL